MRPIVFRHLRQIHGIARGHSSLMGTLALAAAGVLALMLAISVSLTVRSSQEQRLAHERRERTVEVLDMTGDLRTATVSTLRGERGYLLTGDATYLEPYFEGRIAIEQILPELAGAVAGNPVQASRVSRLQQQFDSYLAILSRLVELEASGQHNEAISEVRIGASRNSIEAILNQLDAFDAEEEAQLERLTARAESSARQSALFEYLLGLVGFIILLLGCLVTIFLKRTLEREEGLRRRMEELASTDELTGLWNRRQMLAQLDRQIAVSRRSKRPLSLAILDIDHFKRVNDTHGHPAGDEVIRRVADMARLLMREVDLVGRLGGEEFLIAFPDCSAEQAMAACERLREGIAALPILLPESGALRITLSSGLATLADDDDRTRFIARADEALYAAKQGGRNQVRLAA